MIVAVVGNTHNGARRVNEGGALLRDTLLEAEEQEGVHLGRVLGKPILQRFGDLTAGRYGN